MFRLLHGKREWKLQTIAKQWCSMKSYELLRKYPKNPFFDHSNYRLFERIPVVPGTSNNRGLTVPFPEANIQVSQCLDQYEGCSNMNASSFITFVTYMLRQNGIRFNKGLYASFKLAPDLKKNTVYLSSYNPLNEGRFSILTNQCFEHPSDIDECIILR